MKNKYLLLIILGAFLGVILRNYGIKYDCQKSGRIELHDSTKIDCQILDKENIK